MGAAEARERKATARVVSVLVGMSILVGLGGGGGGKGGLGRRL